VADPPSRSWIVGDGGLDRLVSVLSGEPLGHGLDLDGVRVDTRRPQPSRDTGRRRDFDLRAGSRSTRNSMPARVHFLADPATFMATVGSRRARSRRGP
jgi:hypothetical protein